MSRWELRDRSDNLIVTITSQTELLRLLRVLKGTQAGEELAVVVYDGEQMPARYLLSEVLR